MMRVGLMNLGDSPRVFHNKIQRAVVVPVGRVVIADLDTRTIENLKFPAHPETVYVCDPETKIPEEMQAIVELLDVIDHESHQDAINRFHKMTPPSNFGDVHPSKAQMKRVLRHMVEDFIATSYGNEKQPVHDDVDPEELEREAEKQERDKPPPVHPIRQAKDEALIQSGKFDGFTHHARVASASARASEPAPAREATVQVPAASRGKRRRR
jgi:hypothetical protein